MAGSGMVDGDWNATPEGGLIWFKRYKPEQANDPSVCTTSGETRHDWYLLGVFRDRMEYPALKRAGYTRRGDLMWY